MPESTRKNLLLRISLMAALVAVITALFPGGVTIDFEYQVGSIWNYEDVIAPFPFPVYREAIEYEAERKEAIRNTIPSFFRIDTMTIHLIRKNEIIFRALARLQSLRRDADTRAISQTVFTAIFDSLHALINQQLYQVHLSPEELMLLGEFEWSERNRRASAVTLPDISIAFDRLLRDILQTGYLDHLKSDFSRPTIALHEGKQERIRPIARFLDRGDVQTRYRQQIQSRFDLNDTLRTTVEKLFRGILLPNILYDQERTQIAIDWNIDRVPKTIGIVKENERIVSKHDRVTPETKARLDSYAKAKMDRAGDVNILLQVLGKAGHVTVILFLLSMYLYQFRKRIFYDNSRLLAIAILLLFVCFLSYITFSVQTSVPLEYLIVVPTASMLLTIIFDSRVAVNTTVILALLVSAIRGNDYSIMLASLVGGALSVYTVRDIKSRTQIFRSIIFIFIGYAITIIMLGLQKYDEPGHIARDLLFASANAVISPILTYGLLIFFEKVFSITTDMTFLELSDFNHPLLRKLSTQAPGTFHHSIVMGTLAEAAAKDIGANPILARVGAYYHDIGKIAEPEFFVENQLGTANIHEELEPMESTKHIINHVLHGIALARAYKLPEQIIDFIPAHHGRSVVHYFFDKEKKQNPDADVEDFEYPGPKPRAKETGIVMLADTIEAAARAIEDPTIEKIDSLIDEIIRKRLNEGQLDECELTIRELEQIKKSFLGILTGIHHSRIKYPTAEDEEEARKLAERTQKLLKLPSAIDALSRRIKKIET